jgi:hypothetical protein
MRRLICGALVLLLSVVVLYASTQDRLPTGDSATSNWTALGGGTKFSEVDDPIGTPDDDTTYISKDDSSGAQDFTFAAFAITNGSTINSVQLIARCRERDADDVLQLTGRLQVNSTDYAATSQNVADGATYGDYTFTWATNPNTAVAWTEADVEGTSAAPLQEFGVNVASIAAGEGIRCTQVFARVDYTAAGGASGSAGMGMIGVGELE